MRGDGRASFYRTMQDNVMICALSCSYIGTFCIFFDRIDPGPKQHHEKTQKSETERKRKKGFDPIWDWIGFYYCRSLLSSKPFSFKLSSIAVKDFSSCKIAPGN